MAFCWGCLDVGWISSFIFLIPPVVAHFYYRPCALIVVPSIACFATSIMYRAYIDMLRPLELEGMSSNSILMDQALPVGVAVFYALHAIFCMGLLPHALVLYACALASFFACVYIVWDPALWLRCSWIVHVLSATAVLSYVQARHAYVVLGGTDFHF